MSVSFLHCPKHKQVFSSQDLEISWVVPTGQGAATGIEFIEVWDVSFSRVSYWLGDRTRVSCILGRCFTTWATREAQTQDSSHQKNDMMQNDTHVKAEKLSLGMLTS